jgi:hypothetical protein
LKGGKEVTLTPGQTFYEGPNDIHVLGRNASKTKPAKFVVVLVPESGVKTQAECEFWLDLARLPLQFCVLTLTSFSVRLRSGCVDHLEVCKSPLLTGV